MADYVKNKQVEDAQKFLAWAKENAKKHGVKSEISSLDSITSKYIVRDYNTWGDVVVDAQKQLD